jgi:hypothetical protein
MRSWKQITGKIEELLKSQNIIIPIVDVNTASGRRYMIDYFNENKTEETNNIFITYVNDDDNDLSMPFCIKPLD